MWGVYFALILPMNGKANRRIDFLLDCLLRLEMDNYRYKEKEILLPVNYMVTREEQRYNGGMLIVAERVKVTQ